MAEVERLPCHGGPLDGEGHADIGHFFATIARVAVVRDGVVVKPGWSSGTYERRKDGYHWRSG